MSRHPRFELLDGLRGLAAFVVVLYHLGHWLQVPWLAANGRLAVDFFFCLSGFVVSFAYGDTSSHQLSFLSFLKLRLIRLMPMIWLGGIISGSYLILKFSWFEPQLVDSRFALAFLLDMLNLPYMDAPAHIGGPQVFPLNGPQYSLLLEIAVNIVWFPLRRALSSFHLLFLIILCSSIVFTIGLGGDTSATFMWGFPRVIASFSLGVFVDHLRKRHHCSIDPLLAKLIFSTSVATFLLIILKPNLIQPRFEMSMILLLNPIIVFSGSTVVVAAALTKTCKILGETSYPVYALQYPLFMWFNGFYKSAKVSGVSSEVTLCAIILLVFAWIAARYVDTPVRAQLKMISHQKNFVTRKIKIQ